MKVIRFIFSLPFAIILLVLGIAAGTLFSVRNAYSEKNTEKLMSSIQWAQLELPSDEGTTTLCALANDALASNGLLPISEDDFNEIIRASAADRLVSDFVLDFRAWFFDSAERPVINTDRISEVIVKAAGCLLSSTEKVEIRLPSDKAEVALLSSAQKESGSSQYDYWSEILGMLSEELASGSFVFDEVDNLLPEDADLSEIFRTLTQELASGARDLDKLSDLLPEDVELLDVLGTLTQELASGARDFGEIAALLPEGVDLSVLLGAISEELGSGSSSQDTPDQGTSSSPAFDSVSGLFESMMTEQISNELAESPEIRDSITEFNHALDEIEPYRIVVSSLAQLLLVVCVCIILLILFLINAKGSTLGLPHIGLTSAVDGVLFIAMSLAINYVPAEFFADNHIPESTVRLLADPLFSSLKTTGLLLLTAGLIILIIGSTLGSFRKKR